MVSAPPPARVALVPNAIAFRDPRRGLLGAGWTGCESTATFGCRPQGTISLTADGGRTWKVVLRTPRPVVSVRISDGIESATFDDGEYLTSRDGGRAWRPSVAPGPAASACPPGMVPQTVTTPHSNTWALCTSQGSAGSMGKSVYELGAKGWRRVAYTPFAPPRPGGYGGLSLYGYPLGLTMANDGFGLIWESRGTLFVTRDGGSHWHGLPRVAQPEVDFGFSAVALPHGVGFVVLGRGGGEHRRLLSTRDAGRTWRVVHTWPG